MNFKRSAVRQPHPEHESEKTPEIIEVPLWMKIVVGLFAVAVFGGGVTIYVLGNNIYDFVSAVATDPLSAVLDAAGTTLETDTAGRTNILLLGGGGSDYDGGSDLTDSIMVVSIDESSNEVTLISLPRDLVVFLPEYKEYHRINTLFPLGRKRLGETNKEQLVVNAIENALCQEIHYYAKIDFAGFSEIIDALGGVDVLVDRQFTDYQYPTDNYGYQTVHFDAGVQHMNGETALQFARSRHGTNGEASDFARAARQQKLLQALWEKARSIDVLNDTKKIQELTMTVNEHYETDLKIKEIVTLASIGMSLIKEEPAPGVAEPLPAETAPTSGGLGDKIHSIVLTDGPGGLLYTPTDEVRQQYYGGAFVLLPDGDNFDTICSYVAQLLNNPLQSEEQPSIEVLNGTATGFLARDVGALLVKNGYNVVRRDNTFQHRIYEKTYLYDHSRGGNIATLMDVQRLLSGEVVAENTEPVFFNDIDVTVVIGKDFKFPEGGLGEAVLKSEPRSVEQLQ